MEVSSTSGVLRQAALASEHPARYAGKRALPSRLWVPSFSDLIFLSLLAWLFLSHPEGWLRLLADGDTGWHIRTGEAILRTGHVPQLDPYSFSKPGAPWFAWEWGADVIFGLLHRVWGLKGVVLLGGALIALYGVVVFRFMIWRGTSALPALLVALPAVSAASIHFLARPHLFTLVLIPVTVWILDADRRNPSRLVWLLVPITVFWTNLHGGFLALIAFVGLLAVGSALEAAWDRGWSSAWQPFRRYGLLAALCLLASAANPYGIRLHAHLFEYLRADWIRNSISEFQSPKFRSEAFLHYELLMFAGLIVTGWLLSRRRIVEPLWILFWAHQSLISARHATVLVTVAAPVVAAEISQLWTQWAQGGGRNSLRQILAAISVNLYAGSRSTSIWPAVTLAALLFAPIGISWPEDFPKQLFPVEIVGRHAEVLSHSRLLTSDEWADYLLYRNYPQQRVFFDGRSDFYGQALCEDYLKLMNGRPSWRTLLAKYGFDAALLPVEWPLASMLKTEPGWLILEDDGKAILFQKQP